MNNFIKNHQTYTKINTLYKRDMTKKSHNLLVGDFSLPEFEYLYNLLWSCEEKIDGTNVFIYFRPLTGELEFHGKTENANIPATLVKKMTDVFIIEKMYEAFPHKYEPQLINDQPNPKAGEEIDYEVRVYGEGYGMKIQSGGNYIPDDVGIILFDVKIGNWWLNRADVENISQILGVKTTPLIGIMTLKEAEELVIKGFKSTIAHNKDYDAEGLVCKPIVQLFNRKGERIVCKIKTCDYKQI